MKKQILFPGLLGEMAKCGDTQKELGEIVGLCRASMSYKLSGKVEWSYSEIVAICKHYNKSFEELFLKNEE